MHSNAQEQYKRNVYALAVLLEAFADKVKRDNPTLYCEPHKKLCFSQSNFISADMARSRQQEGYQRGDHLYMIWPSQQHIESADVERIRKYMTELSAKYRLDPMKVEHVHYQGEKIAVDVTGLLTSPEKIHELLTEDQKTKGVKVGRRKVLGYLALVGAGAGAGTFAAGLGCKVQAFNLAGPAKRNADAVGDNLVLGGLVTSGGSLAAYSAVSADNEIPAVPPAPGGDKADSAYKESAMALSLYEQLKPFYADFRIEKAQQLRSL